MLENDSRALQREARERRARHYLGWLGVMAFIASCTAMVTFAYPDTFAAIRGPTIWVHNISGDISVAISLLYLLEHLPRTWKMKKAVVSRWSGFGIVALWTAAALTGLYGQFYPLSAQGLLWWVHFVTSVAVVLGATFHGLWAHRPRRRTTSQA